ncbi:hypothetical protein [Streptomyces sp. NPDC090994]|uniref:hypothetical protein n=1 Tax=Streptomyces sp. NPDC090994 TaxID=3365969 RepID=UPI00380E64B9
MTAPQANLANRTAVRLPPARLGRPTLSADGHQMPDIESTPIRVGTDLEGAGARIGGQAAHITGQLTASTPAASCCC